MTQRTPSYLLFLVLVQGSWWRAISWTLAGPKWEPISRVKLENVSLSYPVSSQWWFLWRKEDVQYPALWQVSGSFEPTHFYLLHGHSGAGKSTMLKVINGSERPSAGILRISYENSKVPIPSPIYLELRPSFRINQKVRDIWERALPSKLILSSEQKEWCFSELSSITGCSLDARISQLQMSQVYGCQLGEGCLSTLSHDKVGEVTQGNNGPGRLIWRAPVILLDEWLDLETSTVIHNVQDTLLRLMAKGAVVICVSHMPERFDWRKKVRRIAMSGGTMYAME